jgi:hypothetical protein
MPPAGAEPLQLGEDVGDARDGHDDVLGAVHRARDLEGLGDVAPNGPDAFDRGPILGDVDLDGPVRLAQVADREEVGLDLGGVVAVDLDQQDGPRPLVGQRLVEVGAGGLEGEPVHELDAGGHHAGRHDRGHDPDGLPRGTEQDEEVGGRLGVGHQLHDRLRHDPEGALGADHEMLEVVAGDVLGELAAQGRRRRPWA